MMKKLKDIPVSDAGLIAAIAPEGTNVLIKQASVYVGGDYEAVVELMTAENWREKAQAIIDEREAEAVHDAAVREAIWELGEAKVVQKGVPQRKAEPQGLLTQSGSEPDPLYGAAPEPANMVLIGAVFGALALVVVGLIWLNKKRG